MEFSVVELAFISYYAGWFESLILQEGSQEKIQSGLETELDELLSRPEDELFPGDDNIFEEIIGPQPQKTNLYW